MIRLFKHYIPHAVLLLALVDMVLLMTAAEFAWRVRADQLGIPTGILSESSVERLSRVCYKMHEELDSHSPLVCS